MRLPTMFHMRCAFPKCVWKEAYVRCSRVQGTSAYRVGLMVMDPKNLHKMEICGRAMHRDLWSFFYSRVTNMKVAVASMLRVAEELHALMINTRSPVFSW